MVRRQTDAHLPGIRVMRCAHEHAHGGDDLIRPLEGHHVARVRDKGKRRCGKVAVEVLQKYNAVSAFLGYRGYPAHICASINDELVHGIPSKERVLRSGDIISIDVGTQYRSAIFYHDELQKNTAEEVIASIDAEEVWGRPIVTEVSPLDAYYPAEDYHQEYYENNPGQAYCQMVIRPKIAKFQKTFKEKRKSALAS